MGVSGCGSLVCSHAICSGEKGPLGAASTTGAGGATGAGGVAVSSGNAIVRSKRVAEDGKRRRGKGRGSVEMPASTCRKTR